MLHWPHLISEVLWDPVLASSSRPLKRLWQARGPGLVHIQRSAEQRVTSSPHLLSPGPGSHAESSPCLQQLGGQQGHAELLNNRNMAWEHLLNTHIIHKDYSKTMNASWKKGKINHLLLSTLYRIIVWHNDTGSNTWIFVEINNMLLRWVKYFPE